MLRDILNPISYSTTFDITRERLRLDGCAQALRIVALSDLHLPGFLKYMPGLVDVVNLQSPDIVVIVGDTVDKAGFEQGVGVLKELEAPLGKFAVLGNWEYSSRLDLDKLHAGYRQAGVTLLVNQIAVAGGIRILGLDDFIQGKPDFDLIGEASAPPKPFLILSHCPESFDTICHVLKGPGVTISGHTHGGQIAPFGKALVTPRGSGSYVKGWYSKRQRSMYVLRGIGTNGIPFRIGAKPEVLVLNLN